ncbi:hypothetical protein IJH33_01750 [Candidatus Saccharibacteria bacterium]|nr:hypothetical protein [Candidatus Saccharibacteria bacterium]
MKTKSNQKIKWGTFGLIGGVAVLGALNATSGAESALADGIDFSVGVSPSSSITIPSTPIALTLNPATNAFDSSTFTVEAGTNNESGYRLIVTATNGGVSGTSGTDLARTAALSDGTRPTIPLLTSEYTQANFPANYWGIKINDGNYKGAASDGTIYSTNTKGGSNLSVTLGAKVDYEKPEGTYAAILNFTVLPNVTTATQVEQLSSMQDFALLTSTEKAQIISNMTVNKNYTLVDSRDGQEYTIAKLGGTDPTTSNYAEVWMTKNLNLAGGTKLNSTTTDMADDYVMPTANGFQADNTLPASATKNSADNNLTDSTQFSDNTMAYVFNSGTTSDCGASGQNVPCYSYYSWTAATLGSGVGVSDAGTNVTASICPKGWRLPTATTSGASATTNNNWKTGDNYALATAYGANLESNYYENAATFYNNAGPLTTVPNFLLAGYYYSGTFSGGGAGGRYWSSTVSSSTDAYRLYFNTSYVYSASTNNRYYGRSVRCMLAG